MNKVLVWWLFAFPSILSALTFFAGYSSTPGLHNMAAIVFTIANFILGLWIGIAFALWHKASFSFWDALILSVFPISILLCQILMSFGVL